MFKKQELHQQIKLHFNSTLVGSELIFLSVIRIQAKPSTPTSLCINRALLKIHKGVTGKTAIIFTLFLKRLSQLLVIDLLSPQRFFEMGFIIYLPVVPRE